MDNSQEGTDVTSIPPVSSLRSRFENLSKDNAVHLASPATASKSPFLRAQSPATDGESNTPSRGRSPHFSTIAGDELSTPTLPTSRRRLTPPRSRPYSMISVTPSQKSPPLVNINSPNSPVQFSPGKSKSIDSRVPTTTTPASFHTNSPPVEWSSTTLLSLRPPDVPKALSDGAVTAPPTPEIRPKSPAVSVPPPVNRAGKPSIPRKPATLTKKTEGLSAPDSTYAYMTDRSVSPFSTPPGSGTSSPGQRRPSLPTRDRKDSDVSVTERPRGTSDASFVERLRSDSESSSIQRSRGDSTSSFAAARSRAQSNASFVEPSSLPEAHHHWSSPPPMHNYTPVRREQQTNVASRTPARYRSVAADEAITTDEASESRPRLPARPELQSRSGRTSPTKARSGRTSPVKALHLHKSAVADGQASHRIPANIPVQRSALRQGFERSAPLSNATASQFPPAIPAPRRSVDRRREAMPVPETVVREEDTPTFDPNVSQAAGPADFPDTSQASRRPPRYRQRPYHISTDYDTRVFAVCGEIACTTGHHTKAWNLRTGEQLLDMMHNEVVKVTSLVFKPATVVEDEGKRIWLGTSIGEIHELDLLSQSVVKTKQNAHVRREIIRMYRYASELWTLDDGGDLNVWKPDHKSMPSLDSQYRSFRVPRGHTFSIALGRHLWIATGKDLWIFAPSVRSDTEFQVLRNAISQQGIGEIHSGTTLSNQPDLVYFGHQDGKVSIYNRSSFACTSVVNVSMYKISSLAGVGNHLWAGFNTGMAYVYDTSTVPWRVRKDWRAHDKQICGISVDKSAVCKLDRVQVVTLGADNMLKIWDGLLEEDWLDSHMQKHDGEYCYFREITAAVLTWNAGASKPHYLLHNKEDNNFFQEYMTSRDSPDIFVFGFQELVDLENKKVTAKSFFKSKKKDANEQEHIGHQYRAWRDHLTKCLDDYLPASQTYSLLHTASLVGLFTCVFVKSEVRKRIRHVQAAEVKRGMGGHHGNKGALVLRMIFDDSSLCFINCHLAAGQTQTQNRNNDIAEILETEALPAYPLADDSVAQHADVFTSGGDGSMILDHEICILNGDLNYRIDTMGRDTVIKHVQQGNLQRLLDRDQLLLSRKKNAGNRLRAFQETEIRFDPTYKYDLQSDKYDTSEKRRAPAWCDRILYRGIGKVKMEEYRRWEVRVSDHRPVSGQLRMRVKTVDAARRKEVWEMCQQEYGEVKNKVVKAVQLEYFTDVLGLSQREASAALKE